jgi:Spy/CpxP family protein refolding chaperone
MKKIILSTVLSIGLATTLIANCTTSGQKCPMGEKCDDMKKHYEMKSNCQTKMMSCDSKKSHCQKKDTFLSIIAQLDLNDKQEVQITKAIDEYKNRPKTSSYDAFSKTDFDKKRYLEISENRKNEYRKAKADMIEKIYNILTKEQKVKLKELIDTKKGSCNAKNCDGRR